MPPWRPSLPPSLPPPVVVVVVVDVVVVVVVVVVVLLLLLLAVVTVTVTLVIVLVVVGRLPPTFRKAYEPSASMKHTKKQYLPTAFREPSESSAIVDNPLKIASERLP